MSSSDSDIIMECPWKALTQCEETFSGHNRRSMRYKHAAAGVCWDGAQRGNVVDRTCPVCGLSFHGTSAIKAHNKMYHPSLGLKVCIIVLSAHVKLLIICVVEARAGSGC